MAKLNVVIKDDVITTAMLALTTTSDVFAGNINGMVTGLEGE
ncbi:MAG: hypothetical protein ACRD8W_08895 [Nitrososphaeraceae archaeon]